MLIRPFLLIVLFKSSIPFLIFCLLLSFIERGVFKSHTCEFYFSLKISVFISCILKFSYLMNWPFYQYDWFSISGKIQFSSVQSLSRVRLFVTPWTAACQASLSITNSQSLLKLMSIKSVVPSNHLILRCPLLLPPSIFTNIMVFSN